MNTYSLYNETRKAGMREVNGCRRVIHESPSDFLVEAMTFRSMCELSCFSRVQLCDPMDCSPPGCSVHEDSPVKNTGVGCGALFQEIFPTQGSSQPRVLTCISCVSCIAGRFFTHWATWVILSHVGHLGWIFQMEALSIIQRPCRESLLIVVRQQ